MEQKYIAALEIGSSHLRMAVATVDPDATVTLLAVEDEYMVDVVRYGWIENVDDARTRINRLIKKIENYKGVSPRKIKALYVGLGGRAMMSSAAQVVRTFDDEREITARIIDTLKDEARQRGVLSDCTVVEVLPRQYVVDNRETLRPIGTFGRDLRAEFNIVTCHSRSRRNLERALTDRLALGIKGSFPLQTAMADLVLTPDECKAGCMLVDFGAETTAISIYKNGTMQYMVTLPIGSRCITRDLMALNYTEEQAEGIKKLVGDCMNVEPTYRRNDFDGNGREANAYIRARATEIAVNIVEQARYAGLSMGADLPAGIVLVGAGSRLRGFADLLQQHSGVKVRLGAVPSSVRISDPRLQGLEALDVIAILSRAAKEGAQECLEAPAPVIDDTVDTADDTDRESILPRDVRKEAERQRREEEKRRRSEEKERERERKRANAGPSLSERFSRWVDGFWTEPEEREEKAKGKDNESN